MRTPWRRWLLLVGVLLMGVLVPGERAEAGDGEPPPDASDCDSLLDYSDALNCNRQACFDAGNGSDACEQLGEEAVPDAPAGTRRISCSYRPPLGDQLAAVSAQDPDAWDHVGGAFKEIITLLGWQPRMDVTVPDNAPEWWTHELVEEGECHLATRYPTSCATDPNRDEAMPTPEQRDDNSADTVYDPSVNGRTADAGTEGILPDPCVGTYRSSQYDIGYSTGGFVDVEDRLNGNLTNLFFGAGKGAVQVAFAFVDYAHGFDLVEGLGSPAEAAWQAYDRQVVGDLHLKELAWLAFVGYLAWLAVRGRLSLVGSEAVTAVLLLAAFTALMANPRGYMEGTSRTIDDVSTSMLQVGCDREGDTSSSTGFDGTAQLRRVEGCAGDGLRRIESELHELFVDEPYRYLNWNWNEEFAASCQTRMASILETGPHGTEDWPRVYMRRGQEAGGPCQAAADFNADATLERTFQALLAGLMAVGVAMVVAGMALTVLLAKFVVAALFAVAPVAAALAVLPGGGRRLATSWMTTLLQAIVAAVGMSLVLSLMMIGLEAVASAPADAGLSLTERWITLLGLVAAVWIARKRFLSALQGVAAQVSQRLARPEPSGGGFGGGGLAGQPSGSSLFAASRVGLADALTVGTTGLTAAASLTSLGLTAGRIGSRVVTVPVRGLRGTARARRASNRILRNNATQVMMTRLLDGYPVTGGGGGGGGVVSGLADAASQMGRAGGLDPLPRDFLQSVVRPRYQRLHDDRVELFGRRRQRREDRRGQRFFSGERWASYREGAADNTVGGIRRAWDRNAPPFLGANPARTNPADYPAQRLRIFGTRREEREFTRMMSRMVYLSGDAMPASSTRVGPPAPLALGPATRRRDEAVRPGMGAFSETRPAPGRARAEPDPAPRRARAEPDPAPAPRWGRRGPRPEPASGTSGAVDDLLARRPDPDRRRRSRRPDPRQGDGPDGPDRP